jgi:hypothetical protein
MCIYHQVDIRFSRELNTCAASRRRSDVAGPTMKVGAKLGLHGFEASRDQFNSWHPSVFELRQAGHTRVAALRAA